MAIKAKLRMMKRGVISLAFATCLVAASQCFAQPLQERIGVDRFAHAGVSYVISDQLKRHTKLTPLERVLVVAGVGAFKELVIDRHWDNGDFLADCSGIMLYEIKF